MGNCCATEVSELQSKEISISPRLLPEVSSCNLIFTSSCFIDRMAMARSCQMWWGRFIVRIVLKKSRSSVKNRKMIINYLLSIKRHSESKTQVIRPTRTKRRKCHLRNTKRRMIMQSHSSSPSSRTMTAKMKVKVPSKKAKMKLRTQKNQMKCRRCYPRPIMKLKILCLSISCHNKSFSPAT